MGSRPTQFPTSHRQTAYVTSKWIAGDIHIYLKFALKVTDSFRKRRF